MNSKTVHDILAEQDIVPVGNFEARPVYHRRSGLAHDYPDVVILKSDVAYGTLYSEAVKNMERIGPRYLKDRLPYLDSRIPLDQLLEFISDVGFQKDYYQSYSLRRLGSVELEDYVQGQTRKFFDSLPTLTFRQHYAVAKSGWKTKLHLDHKDFKTHGFRAMMPLSGFVYMGYVSPFGESLIYRLAPGNMYFVNTAKMHRGFSFGEERTNLIFQMNSDEMILDKNAVTLAPISDVTNIPVEMFTYETVMPSNLV